MNKPEKPKKFYLSRQQKLIECHLYEGGFNRAYDEMEAYYQHRLGKIPSEEELAEIIKSKHIYHDFNSDEQSFVTIPLKDLAKAISKRLEEVRGE